MSTLYLWYQAFSQLAYIQKKNRNKNNKKSFHDGMCRDVKPKKYVNKVGMSNSRKKLNKPPPHDPT